jgi:ferric-dicitrate binding protein FerR (iron transport regulator)
MTEGQNIPDELIARYLAGEVSPAERQEIENWAAESADNQAILDASKKLWDLEIEPDLPELNTELAWKKVSERIRKEDHSSDSKIVSFEERRKRVFLMKIAATVISVLVVGSILFMLLNQTENLRTFTAGAEAISFTLPDSSEVVLEPGSEFSFDPSNYNSRERKVFLKGSAFFDVEKDASKPFYILTPNSEVRVLGTSFKVSDKSGKDSVFVSVITGKVRLTSATNETIEKDLEAGDEGVLILDENQIVSRKIETNELRFQLNKTIIFKETDLNHVCQTLSRIYRQEVRLENPNLRTCLLTATFSEQDLPEIMTIIAGTFGLDTEQDNKGYVLKGKACE